MVYFIKIAAPQFVVERSVIEQFADKALNVDVRLVFDKSNIGYRVIKLHNKSAVVMKQYICDKSQQKVCLLLNILRFLQNVRESII